MENARNFAPLSQGRSGRAGLSAAARCAAAALWLLVLGACLEDKSRSDFAYGQAFKLRASESARVGDDGLTIGFEGVSSDSRCPADVACVWEGDAAVRLRLSAPPEPALTVELHTAQGDREALYAGRIRVRLAALGPLPISTRPIAAGDYVATLVATPR